jgi:hypothetical protein
MMEVFGSPLLRDRALVAFLRADSKSNAVFAAATIEFIGVFNV